MNGAGKNKLDGDLRKQIIICIILGVFLLLADAYLEQYAHRPRSAGEEKSAGTTVILEEGELLHFWSRILEALGIASLIFGVFTLFLELRGLRIYFLERMKELVIEKQYLKSLSAEELKKIQLLAIQAHFKLEEVPYGGSFLEFLYRDIYSYIGAPYRERVTLEIRYEQEGEDLFVARDRLSYICRKSGEKILSAIIWQNDPGEVEEIRDLKVAVQYPQEHEKHGPPVLVGKLTEDKKRFEVWDIKSKEMIPLKEENGGGDSPVKGRELRINSVESYEEVDRLKVVIDAVYTIKADHFAYWLMVYPTKDFSLILVPPDSHIVQAATFINNEHIGELNKEPGYYSFTYNSWMIPQSGVAWRLIPVEGTESAPASET